MWRETDRVRSVVELSAGVFVATSRREPTTSARIFRGTHVVVVDPARESRVHRLLVAVVDRHHWD